MTLIQEQKHRGFLMDPINNMHQTVFREITKLWFISRRNTLLFSFTIQNRYWKLSPEEPNPCLTVMASFTVS